MKPHKFDYVRPTRLEEALDILSSRKDDVRIIAGGLSLVAMMNFRLVEPAVLMDIVHIESLGYIKAGEQAIEVGAITQQARLLAWDRLPALSPLLAKGMPHIGHFQTRSRGTVGGSIAHSDPSSELPLCLAVLDGSVTLASTRGTRNVKAEDFQVGLMTTDKQADEMVTAVHFPVARPGTGYAFDEVTMRHGDLAICAIAVAATKDRIRMGVGGVADKPTVREWPALSGKDLDEALNEFAWDLHGMDDVHATAQYRRQLVRKLGRKVILEAQQCCK